VREGDFSTMPHCAKSRSGTSQKTVVILELLLMQIPLYMISANALGHLLPNFAFPARVGVQEGSTLTNAWMS
jgi:hypothetical protein